MAKNAEFIFIPVPVQGHLLVTIELANRLINHDRRISKIHLLLWKLPFAPHADAYARSLAASQPRINLVDLPDTENPPPMDLFSSASEAYIYEYIAKTIPLVRKTIKDIVSSSSGSDPGRVSGLVLDFFCADMIDVGNEVNLPSYIFLTSNLGFLGMMKFISERHRTLASNFDKSSVDEEFSIPGFVNPVPTRVLPSGLFRRESYEAYVKLASRFVDAKGILVNSFEELEQGAAEYFSCGRNYPPVYSVGPILNLTDRPYPDLQRAKQVEIIEWLDGQPESSVVFLCFGSMGIMGAPQVKEIARSLEVSAHRFLWSIRTNPMEKARFEDLLPDGFLDRVAARGMVCGWAPQVEVLAHSAIGGFVSHCGWNSLLESLWNGVPVVTWPLYAEQQLNAFTLVKELQLAVEMRLDFVTAEGEIVMASEIVEALGRLMEGDGTVRKKVKEMENLAKKAVMEGGSSFTALGKFIRDVVEN